MGLTILLGIFGVSVVIGIPVAFAMGIAALTAFWYEGFPLLITFQRSVSGISVFSLLAIPFFVFAGELMLHGGIAMRLVKFASALVGHVRGGLASVNIFSSMLFGGISGSAVADISALGSILIPVMKERGYHSDYAVNVTVTSSIAGIVIPPSHNMIIFAVAAGGGISISKLFLAGVVPGMLMCLCLAVAAYVIAIKRNYPAEPFPGWRAVGVASLHALPGLVTAVIIVGGVLSGIFTVTESGAFGAIYALLLTYFVYRSLDWNGFKTAVVSAVRTTAMVMVLIGFASSFAYLLALYQVPEKLSSFMLGISEEKIAVLLMINIMLLVLGMIMDMAALILICTPIFLPIVRDLGMDPTQFGIMLLVNLGLGLCTPPLAPVCSWAVPSAGSRSRKRSGPYGPSTWPF
ncbi:C4-dicarboxylate ABC transporter permease (plasmid) [Sulfitobacter pontiacus]|nr:C4-dicarboxylate ABC transporter permease [Sulfitobacter pontiacus]